MMTKIKFIGLLLISFFHIQYGFGHHVETKIISELNATLYTIHVLILTIGKCLKNVILSLFPCLRFLRC